MTFETADIGLSKLSINPICSIPSAYEIFLPFGGFYVGANFGENRSRNATVRVLADGQIHTNRRKPILKKRKISLGVNIAPFLPLFCPAKPPF